MRQQLLPPLVEFACGLIVFAHRQESAQGRPPRLPDGIITPSACFTVDRFHTEDSQRDSPPATPLSIPLAGFIEISLPHTLGGRIRYRLNVLRHAATRTS